MMTRKRFVKLVMSYEIPRNKAEALTSLVAKGQDYGQAYAKIEADLKRLKLFRHPECWIALGLLTYIAASFVNENPEILREEGLREDDE